MCLLFNDGLVSNDKFERDRTNEFERSDRKI